MAHGSWLVGRDKSGEYASLGEYTTLGEYATLGEKVRGKLRESEEVRGKR